VEVEEVLYATQLVSECVAFGVDHASLGHAIQVIAVGAHFAMAGGQNDDVTGTGNASKADLGDVEATKALLAECRTRMPAYMVPHGVEWVKGPLPRNPNGKIDRKLLSTDWVARREVV
jgi:acyl-CoA synthetase (AMP-forming)/AMP-acid ligase II